MDIVGSQRMNSESDAYLHRASELIHKVSYIYNLNIQNQQAITQYTTSPPIDNTDICRR